MRLFRIENSPKGIRSECRLASAAALFSILFLNACTIPGVTPIPNPSPSVSPFPSPTPSPSPSASTPNGPTYSIQVSWRANHESAVNTTGGGYRVYYATAPSVNTSTASFVNVPYVSGPQTPTSTRLTNLSAGKYYFRVVAFSALNSKSSDSAETSLTVP